MHQNNKNSDSSDPLPRSIPLPITALTGAAMFTGVINILALIGPLFMLQVYDRVLPSQSLPTLIALMLLVICVYSFSGILDVLRNRLMSRVACALDVAISSMVFLVVSRAQLKIKMTGDAQRPVQELDQIRTFLAGPGPVAFFDLPWVPIYIAVCFYVHPYIGWMTISMIVILISLTVINDIFTRRWSHQASLSLAQRNVLCEQAASNAVSMAAMGMHPEANIVWQHHHGSYIRLHRKSADIAGLCAGISKALRFTVQSGALAVGAFLVINGDLSGGMIIAATIIVAKALAPAEQVIAAWRSFVAAKVAWRRLQEIFALLPAHTDKTRLPAPDKNISVEGLFLTAPGCKNLIVQNLNFSLKAGSALGVVGASASGKSSMTKALVGSWAPARGQVCFDGVPLDLFPQDMQGQLIGYMSQSVELFTATVAQNIARLDCAEHDDQVIAAARLAGVHELIVQLPDGYQTLIGPGALELSAGQRQRIALARALYRDPFLVVLDEPNSNLDREGERALAHAIMAVRKRGGIVVVVAHRTNILSVLDHVLILDNGTQTAFGLKERVLKAADTAPAAAQGVAS